MMNQPENQVPAQTAGLSEVKRGLLFKYLSGTKDVGNAGEITPRPQGTHAPLSFAQQQIWLHEQMTGDIPFYNETLTIYRHGPLDTTVLNRCLVEIVRRHEIWRTTF